MEKELQTIIPAKDATVALIAKLVELGIIEVNGSEITIKK